MLNCSVVKKFRGRVGLFAVRKVTVWVVYHNMLASISCLGNLNVHYSNIHMDLHTFIQNVGRQACRQDTSLRREYCCLTTCKGRLWIVAGCSKHGNDTSYSTKVGNFLAYWVTVSFSHTCLSCIPRPVQQTQFPNILRRTIISAAKSQTHEGKRRIYTEFCNYELHYVANTYLRYFLHVSSIN